MIGYGGASGCQVGFRNAFMSGSMGVETGHKIVNLRQGKQLQERTHSVSRTRGAVLRSWWGTRPVLQDRSIKRR